MLPAVLAPIVSHESHRNSNAETRNASERERGRESGRECVQFSICKKELAQRVAREMSAHAYDTWAVGRRPGANL